MKNFYLLLLSFLLIGVLSCGGGKKDYEELLDDAAEDVLLEDFEEDDEVEFSEAELEAQRIYDEYISNSLNTGAMPYAYCFGKNKSCEAECSQIKVTTSYNSDVLVTIKKNGEVYRHAYIEAGNSYIFEIPNGTYQPFFYYGKGWYPDKEMKQTTCGLLKGGFVSNESFGKDDPQTLTYQVLTYELSLQENGNFSTRPSNPGEAF